MMLIICDKSPDKAVDWLVENTDKRFCWKQLLELCQLLASAGITDKMDALSRGKEIQRWIAEHKNWVYSYLVCLVNWAKKNIKMSMATVYKIDNIMFDLFKVATDFKKTKTAIWRYSKEYESEYPTNSELPIEVVCELYKTYLREFKGLGKKEVC